MNEPLKPALEQALDQDEANMVRIIERTNVRYRKSSDTVAVTIAELTAMLGAEYRHRVIAQIVA